MRFYAKRLDALEKDAHEAEPLRCYLWVAPGTTAADIETLAARRIAELHATTKPPYDGPIDVTLFSWQGVEAMTRCGVTEPTGEMGGARRERDEGGIREKTRSA